MIYALFWALLILCCLFAIVAGGSSGRIGAALLISATLATHLVQQSGGWSHTNLPVMAVDLLLLAGLFGLALWSEAYWPIWATGFHLITIAGHFASLTLSEVQFRVYFGFVGLWSIFGQLAMVIGIALDRSQAEPHPR